MKHNPKKPTEQDPSTPTRGHPSKKELTRALYGPPSRDPENDGRIIRHLDVCPLVCQKVVERIDNKRNKQAAKAARDHLMGTERAWRFPRIHPLFFLAAMLLSAIPATLSWKQASTAVLAPLDFWKLFQHDVIRYGLMLGGVVVVAAVIFSWFKSIQSSWRLAIPAIVGLLVVSTGAWAVAAYQEHKEMGRLNALFLSHRWVVYESPTFDPDTNPSPSKEVMTRELRALHDQGNFDGLISTRFSTELLEAAAAARFRAVILGIYVKPTGEKPEADMKRAIAYENATRDRGNLVVGYCLGHNTTVNVPLESLASWMSELRKATGKPVTSTFPLVAYLGDRGKSIRETGDFFFPDVHPNFHLGITPANALQEMRVSLEQVTQLSGKPVLLKMVTFPSGPAELDKKKPGFTEAGQEEFYRELTRDVYLPNGVQTSVFNGFDLPWKGIRKDEFSSPEEFVGLFTAEGKPKSALNVVNSKDWPIQHRP